MITAALVKELREKTGAGMMDCKKVLTETNGDEEKAIELLRERGLSKAAKKLNIPIIGLVDTNCNPEDVDYVIPGNDDAIRAIKLIIEAMANAVIESKQGESEETVESVEENFEETSEPQTIEEVVAAESESAE